MFRTSRKKNKDRQIAYFNYIDNFFSDAQKTNVPLIFKLTRRTVLFLFLFQSVSMIFYGIGNYQGLLDENILFVVKTVKITSFFLSVFSFSGTIQTIVFLRAGKKTSPAFVLNFSLMAFTFILSIVAMVFFSLVGTLSKGFPS